LLFVKKIIDEPDHSKEKSNLRIIANCMFKVLILFVFCSGFLSAKQDTCSAEAFDYQNFNNVKDLSYLGTSGWLGNSIEINQSAFFTVGAVWYPRLVPVRYGFICRFTYSIGLLNQGDAIDDSPSGADGFAFVIQNAGPQEMGQLGDGIGYAGISNSIAVEFDTYNNSYKKSNQWNEPNGNHVAVQSNGEGSNSSYHNMVTNLGINPNIPDLTKGGEVRIDYNYVPNTFRVFINNVLYINVQNIDLNKKLRLDNHESAYIGFTGATANACEDHVIHSWFFCPFISQLNEIDISSRTNKICVGDTVTLFATPGYVSYVWSDGTKGEKLTVNKAGRYSVEALNPKGDTLRAADYEIFTIPLPVPTIKGDTVICENGGKTTLTVNENYKRYNWSTGDTTRSVTINRSGFYYLTVLDSNGCENTIRFRITAGDPVTPEIVIVGNNPFCYNDSVVLKTQLQYKNYKWSNSEISPDISVKTAGEYFVEVVDENGCTGISQKIKLEQNPYNPPLISGDFEICGGSTGELVVETDYSNYKWSTGDSTKKLVFSQPGKYGLTVIDKFGCRYDTIVNVKQISTVKVKILGMDILCPDSEIDLSVDNDFVTYKWSTGETTKAVKINKSGKYSITVTDKNGCTGTDSITIHALTIVLAGLNSLALDTTFVGTEGFLTSNIKNINKSKIVISSIKIKGLSKGRIYIKSVPVMPIRLDSSETFQVTFGFLPDEFIDYTDSVEVMLDEPCNMSISCMITGISKDKVLFSLPDLTGKISSSVFAIPVKMSYSNNSDKKFSYRTKISFDSRSFSPDSISTGKLLSYNITNDKGTVEYSDTARIIKKGESILTNIYGRILLGNASLTDLTIESMLINRDDVIPEIANGTLKVNGVCNGTFSQIKLIEPLEISLSPNPSSDYTCLNFKNLPTGGAVLKIYSLNGILIMEKIIKTDESSSNEEMLDISKFPTGAYSLMFKTDSEIFRLSLIVVR